MLDHAHLLFFVWSVSADSDVVEELIEKRNEGSVNCEPAASSTPVMLTTDIDRFLFHIYASSGLCKY